MYTTICYDHICTDRAGETTCWDTVNRLYRLPSQLNEFNTVPYFLQFKPKCNFDSLLICMFSTNCKTLKSTKKHYQILA